MGKNGAEGKRVMGITRMEKKRQKKIREGKTDKN